MNIDQIAPTTAGTIPTTDVSEASTERECTEQFLTYSPGDARI